MTAHGNWEPNDKIKTILAALLLILAIFVMKMLGA